ncbi:MAG: FMN-binding protein [Patescibacteria group bacterium]|jgi:uncharacterized protein with FMN-binding domain
MKVHLKKLILSGFVIAAFVFYSAFNRSAVKNTGGGLVRAEENNSSGPGQPSGLAGYKDGQYVGAASDAYYGNIQVKAVISGGKITDVVFLDHPQDQQTSILINNQAMPILKSEAINAQNAQVDIVSGATDTSQAFISSLSSALSQASGQTSVQAAGKSDSANNSASPRAAAPSAPPASSVPPSTKITVKKQTTASSPASSLKDGTYTGASFNVYYGNVQVRATIAGGKITNVAFLDYPKDRQTSVLINTQAMPILKSEAIKAQNSNVNTVSGATYTSTGFKQSLASALSQAAVKTQSRTQASGSPAQSQNISQAQSQTVKLPPPSQEDEGGYEDEREYEDD